MIEFINVPVPPDRVLDVYRFLTTEEIRPPESELAEVEPSTIEPPPAIEQLARETAPKRKRSKRQNTASTHRVEQAKSVVKRMGTFTIDTLAAQLNVSISLTRMIASELQSQGWVERVTPHSRHAAAVWRYVPAPDSPYLKRRDDPPEVTGRGATGATEKRGEVVAGTGKQETPTGEIGKLVSTLREQGWIVQRTGSNHYKATKGLRMAILPATPSDHRSLANTRAQLRKFGANV